MSWLLQIIVVLAITLVVLSFAVFVHWRRVLARVGREGELFLRFFCHVTPTDDQGRFGDLSLAYFMALKKTGAPIRVLACNLAFVANGRWSEYNEEFVRSIPKKYINVICGDNGELVRLFTVGTTNIAITASYNGEPTINEIATLQKFDAVICPSAAEAAIYRALGIDAVYLLPEAAALAGLLREYL